MQTASSSFAGGADASTILRRTGMARTGKYVPTLLSAADERWKDRTRPAYPNKEGSSCPVFVSA
jgi:hypothetical protein